MPTPTPLFSLTDVDATLAALTLEEKASLLSGENFWTTKAVTRGAETLVPSIWMTDGPHGLRKQDGVGDHLGLGDSVPATCFPTAVTLGSTWDTELLHEVGAALGRESRAQGVGVLLGPGANIKRDPRCGRNFEYLSEDPVLSGDLAAAIIRGVQSEGVGTSLKHFAANNQETDRMRISAEVDARTLREIYLASFERAIAQGDPWTIMCAYNRVNGIYASQNEWLLSTVLRKEWGWDGLVVSDWGAVRDRVAAVVAGLDLEMPAVEGRTDAEIVAAVRNGEIDESVVDAAVRNVLVLVARTVEGAGAAGTTPVDHPAHQALARRAAAAGAVLLRNVPVTGPDGSAAPLLPLTLDKDVAFIGEFARTPRYQGAGSSQVNPTRLRSALEVAQELLGTAVPFAPGFAIEEGPATTASGAELLGEAVTLAQSTRTVVLYLGLPAAVESEGFDRTSIDLPADQVTLLEAVAAVNPRVVVVLSNGAVVTTSGWQSAAPAVVETWLSGQEGAAGVLDVLTGAVNPSGKLAETIPVRLEDVPSFGSFPGGLGSVRYAEGLLVGYRWYDTRRAPVAYPFGFGLSYTTFEIDQVEATMSSGTGGEAVEVRARVTNTGERAGAEVVQVYVSDPDSAVERPEQELKAHARVELAPGESRVVSFELGHRGFAFWHPILERWTVEGGEFTINVGSSSRDIAARVRVSLDGDDITLPVTLASTASDLRRHPVVGDEFTRLLGTDLGQMTAMVDDMPLESLISMHLIPITREEGFELAERANAARA